MLITKKKVSVFIRRGEHPFVMKSLFVCRAVKQGWSDAEINALLRELAFSNPDKVYQGLKVYIKK